MFRIFWLKQTTKTKVAMFKFFLNFLSALYKFRNVLIVLYICKYILQFLFYFMLAKVVRCKCIYVQPIVLLHCYLNKIQKTDPSLGLGKKLKSYATIAPLSIFSLGKGKETFMPQTILKNF